MPDPRALGAILVAIFVGSLVLRLMAARQPNLRRWANLATLLILVAMVALIAFVAGSVVAAFGQAFSR